LIAIYRDPFILHKSTMIKAQVHWALLVQPLNQLSPEEHTNITDMIIVFDGLNECYGLDAQVDIIDVIMISAATGTSRFLCTLVSLPEPNIVATLSLARAPEISWILLLPMASFANADVEVILRDGFDIIMIRVGLRIGMSASSSSRGWNFRLRHDGPRERL
jgi:hypothetical protein